MRADMTLEAEPLAPAAVLEANLDWIRALAGALARDPEAADELAQETCVAALEAPAHPPRSFRPWIATVMRNLWRERGRSQERRRARESRGDLTGRATTPSSRSSSSASSRSTC
jgi:DNA-directed RNA polymerase specialized sigma24 family protein